MDKVISVESKGTAKIIRYRDKQISVLFGDESDIQLAEAFEAVVDECISRQSSKLPELIDIIYKVYLQGWGEGKRNSRVATKSMFDKLLDGIF